MKWLPLVYKTGIPGGSQGLVQGAAVASIWPGERLRKKEWICRSRPGQVTAVLATSFCSAAPIRSAGLSCGLFRAPYSSSRRGCFCR